MKKRNRMRLNIILVLLVFPFHAKAQCWKMISSEISNHTLAIKSDGTLWSCGFNVHGQLGNGNYFNDSVFKMVGTDNNWSMVKTGYWHSVGLKTDGTLWAWGFNNYGQLGDGSNIGKNIPTQIGLDRDWKIINAGFYFTIAIKTDGTLWAWGDNIYGQLGDGTTKDKNLPIKIGSDNNWNYISAGNYHVLAIKNDGTLWSWGDNSYGQLGDNGLTSIDSIPKQIEMGTTWSSINAGGYFSLGIKSDGSLSTWGNNMHYQLGDGTTIHRNKPKQIGTDMDWGSVGAGFNHAMALKTDGSLWGWGGNPYGQIGNGSTAEKYVPTKINLDQNWASISIGNFHSTAFKIDGTFYTWGLNIYGQLGRDSTKYFQPKPVFIECPTTNIVEFDRLESKMKVYPNPVSDLLYIKNEIIDEVTIVDLFGKIVLASKNVKESINVTNLKPALYLIKIVDNGFVTQTSFLKY